MKVTLNYFGQLRQAARLESEECEVPGGAGLKELVAERATAHGEAFRNIILDEAGEFRPSAMILVNGVGVEKADPPALSDGDAVNLLSAIAGG